MKEKMLERFKFLDELQEKLVMLVVYQNRPPKELSLQYGLPNVHILLNWVNVYKKALEKGAITLPPMQPKNKKDAPALKQRIRQLEKSLEKANVMIYGLNAIIDYAEKELTHLAGFSSSSVKLYDFFKKIFLKRDFVSGVGTST